ncbi:protein SUPPRESSOR OF PHYA-105 1-like [Mangifera indica]|uniref:protein SUPPRESSOR OF PHYA-105 1-like n=1 Tax=Mangifera indica TaxID=29780 RepID=UPI001CFA865C|nr:protein SUPPRESSOR OF PHYA-105 1-like [Mangifera indica]
MDQVGDEVSASDINGNAKLKRIEGNLSLKLEGHNMLESPIICASVSEGWPESSIHNFTNATEASLSGSEPPCSSLRSLNNRLAVVEDLTVGNHMTRDSDIVSSPNSSGQGQWQQLQLLASVSEFKGLHRDSMSQEKGRVTLRVKEQFMKISSDIQSPNYLSRKQIDKVPEEVSPYLRARENMIVSSKTAPFGNTQLKTLSMNTPGVSQLFVKKTLKGKGITSSNPDTQRDLGSAVVRQNDEKLGCLSSKVVSDSLFKSSTSYVMIPSHGVNRLGPESLHAGICLREWLRLRRGKGEKVESLHIFRQIVELVDSVHSQGIALQDLQPSYFYLSPSNGVIYTGSFAKRESNSVVNQDLGKKRPLEQDTLVHCNLAVKQQKLNDDMKSVTHQSHFFSSSSSRTKKLNETDFSVNDKQVSEYVELHTQNVLTYPSMLSTKDQQSFPAIAQLEEKWYISPEELNDAGCTFRSNIYGLGVLLFELLCYFESAEVQSAAMLNLHHRILPPKFLYENSKEAGFCLWLLHPEPLSRPTTREILQSDLICISQELHSYDDINISAADDEDETELLLRFLVSLQKQKQKHASKLVEDIGCLEEDIEEVEGKHLQKISSLFTQTHKECFNARKQGFSFEDSITSAAVSQSFSVSSRNEARLMRNISQLEDAYFSIKFQNRHTEDAAIDKDLLTSRDRWSELQNMNESSMAQKSDDRLGAFFEGLCKFTRYNKFKVCGTLRNGDLLNSANVICSLSFDRDEEYVAAAGVSKRIKIFEFNSLLSGSIDIHYPAVELSNRSKLSCVCWNNYIRNYLASTDYDGIVQMWDASTGQGFSHYAEHQKRAWSVDFSQLAPTSFASGSDDCSVKLWNINEKNSVGTIRNPANVCCVQFSSFFPHLLVFGSADYKLHCYDIRNTRVPWCTLAGHEKAVSYVKFLDSETLVSASTDNTLKLWDLRKSSPSGLSVDACSLTFSGHTNEKNFVGLSVLDGYIACGSETNEVYSYYRSLPMPITSHKFGSIDPISGHESGDDNGQFVSSVCWRQKSNMVVAANSTGCIKLLQLVP